MITPTKIYLHYLECMNEVLVKVANFKDKDLSAERLHHDMFPLVQQAKTAISFTLRSACPLAGREIVSFRDDDETLDSVFRELRETVNYLESIGDQEFKKIDTLTVNTAAGFADLKFDGWEYYLLYSMPNFFFHYSMVYALARKSGVKIGKSDFDHFHNYPLGFTFTDDPEEAPIE